MALLAGSTANFNLSGFINELKAFGAFNNASNQVNWTSINQQFTIGAGAGLFNFGSIGSRSVTAGTPDDVDLTSTLLSTQGVVCNFADIVLLIVQNQAGSVGNLVVGNAAANAFSPPLSTTGTLTLNPGMLSVIAYAPLAAGYTVDATHKILRFTSSSGLATYNYLALGH